MTPIAPLVTGFLREHLPIERGFSPHTCETYAYAFRLLLLFASKRLGKSPSQLCLEDLDATLVLDFLADFEKERGNSPASRNGRLAAIKSFMRFVEFRVPAALEQVWQIRAIPMKRHDQILVRHLTIEEVRAVPQRAGSDNAIRHPRPRNAALVLRMWPARLGTGGSSAGQRIAASLAKHHRLWERATATLSAALERNGDRIAGLVGCAR